LAALAEQSADAIAPAKDYLRSAITQLFLERTIE